MTALSPKMFMQQNCALRGKETVPDQPDLFSIGTPFGYRRLILLEWARKSAPDSGSSREALVEQPSPELLIASVDSSRAQVNGPEVLVSHTGGLSLVIGCYVRHDFYTVPERNSFDSVSELPTHSSGTWSVTSHNAVSG